MGIIVIFFILLLRQLVEQVARFLNQKFNVRCSLSLSVSLPPSLFHSYSAFLAMRHSSENTDALNLLRCIIAEFRKLVSFNFALSGFKTMWFFLFVCLSVGLFVCTSVCIVYCLFCHFTFICICISEAILDMGLYVSTSVTGSYIIHGTMADKMMYILHYGTQNYAFSRLLIVVETFGQSAKWTNPSKFNKSSQCC